MSLILATERLRLREMEAGDLEFVADMLGDPDVMRFYPQVYRRDQALVWLQRQQQRYLRDGVGLWLVELADSQQPVGQVGIVVQQVEQTPLHEIGYLIHHPFWRQGFAREAVTGCLELAFTTLRVEEIHSLVRPVNIPSLRTALSVGMQPWRLVDFHGLEHLLMGIRRPS